MKLRFTIRDLLWLVLVAVLAGCGHSNPLQRLPICGTVTLAGGEMPNGSINFIPDDSNSGPAAMTTLKDGTYQFNQTNGPMAGLHKVIVRQFIPQNRIPQPSADDLKSDTAKSAATEIKPAPKTEWKVSVNLKNGESGPYDFTLEP